MDLTLFLIPIVLSPGPNNILFSVLGSRMPFRKVLPFFLSTNFTVLVYTVSILILTAPLKSFFEQNAKVMAWVGASYLFFLAYQLWNEKSDSQQDLHCPSFFEGLLFGFSNYKVVYAVLLAHSFWLQRYGSFNSTDIPYFALIFVGVGVSGHIIWFFSGKLLGQIERFHSLQQKLFSLLLVTVGLWIGLS